MMDIESEEYSKTISTVDRGRKNRISQKEVLPKITRYSKEKLCDADIGCGHSQQKTKGVVCYAGDLTRNDIVGKFPIFYNMIIIY